MQMYDKLMHIYYRKSDEKVERMPDIVGVAVGLFPALWEGESGPSEWGSVREDRPGQPDGDSRQQVFHHSTVV